jgi:hypothetical protein
LHLNGRAPPRYLQHPLSALWRLIFILPPALMAARARRLENSFVSILQIGAAAICRIGDFTSALGILIVALEHVTSASDDSRASTLLVLKAIWRKGEGDRWNVVNF